MNNRGKCHISRACGAVARRSWPAILAVAGLVGGADGATIRADTPDSQYTALTRIFHQPESPSRNGRIG
jgi:hypothetical protein